MKKVIRDGMVAVIYSPGYGAGWYSWNNIQELLFDPEIVKLIEDEKFSNIEKYVKATYGDSVYCGGVNKLRIAWVAQGTQFKIDEYDGFESVVELGRINFIVA